MLLSRSSVVLCSDCAMEAQAQEGMEREVACDVEVEWAPMQPGRTHRVVLYADVGDDSIRRVNAELSDYERVGLAETNPAYEGTVRLVDDAILRDGRMLIQCGFTVTDYDDDGAVESEEHWLYRRVVVRTSTQL